MRLGTRKTFCLALIAPALLAATFAFAEGKPGSNGKSFTPGATMEGQTKKVKYKDKTDIDFEDTTIEGTAKNPFASLLTSRDQEFKQGFIKIRYDWHDQLIMSVSGLSQ